jgi:hypothetical protein
LLAAKMSKARDARNITMEIGGITAVNDWSNGQRDWQLGCL